jgi:hypothetical protein
MRMFGEWEETTPTLVLLDRECKVAEQTERE